MSTNPATPQELLALPVFGGRSTRRHLDAWWGALQQAATLPEDQLPQPVPVGDGPPPPNRWAERDPVAAKRLARARAAVAALADQHSIPAENLIPPDAVRRLAWAPPPVLDETSVRAALTATGARAWQVELTAAELAAALPEPPPPPVPAAVKDAAEP